MLKRSPSDKINVTKNALFFFRELQLITVLLLIRDSYISYNIRFVSLKVFLGFSISDSVSFSLKFIFLPNKKHGLYIVIIPFIIEMIKLYTVLLPDL